MEEITADDTSRDRQAAARRGRLGRADEEEARRERLSSKKKRYARGKVSMARQDRPFLRGVNAPYILIIERAH